MGLRCWMFGHIPASGCYRSDDQYFKAVGGATDGIGREHWDLYGKCRWCDQEYRVGKVHGPLDEVQENRIAWNKRLAEMERRCVEREAADRALSELRGVTGHGGETI